MILVRIMIDFGEMTFVMICRVLGSLDERVGFIMNARDCIKGGFKELLYEKPYRSIKVSDICSHSHISRKSFYSYFNNKEDVLSEIFIEDVVDPIRNINSLFTYAQTKDMYSLIYEKIYEEIYKNSGLYIRLVKPMRGMDDTFLRVATNAIYDLNIEILSNQDFKGGSRKADYVAYFFASSQAMLIQKWICDEMPYTPKELGSLYDEMTRRFWMETFGSK